MTVLKDALNISAERYIEIKKIAYTYYEQYNSLDRPSRRKFLEALPRMDTQFETDILVNTLLFPDTSYLLSLEKGRLSMHLGKIAKNDDNITIHNITTKIFEYFALKTRELVQSGKLHVMDELSYPIESITDKEYREIKEDTLRIIPTFYNLTLAQKAELIAKASKTDSYQAKIQIATLLIPNDKLLMLQLQRNSLSELAEYYKVPVSLIEFKMDEYDRQGTAMLLNDGKLLEFKSRRVWYRDSLDDSAAYAFWDQSFYRQVENSGITKINTILESVYNGFQKKL